jgi:hypothetical protein
MSNLGHIFNINPLLKHCNEKERSFLASQGRVTRIRSRQEIDLKKIGALNIILDGVFELEIHGKNECIYLTPGSFFGDFPFTEIKNRGTVKAVSDGSLLNFNTDSLYKFFFMNYRALRGYVKALNGMGMDVSPVGKSLFSNRTKIVTVFSNDEHSGKSLFAASLALALADAGKSILLDMSYGGNSVFNVLGRKITQPLSQKQVESTATDELITERLEMLPGGPDLLNILQGAKVNASPSIISPLVLALSKGYKYIIIDLGDADAEFRDRVFEQSDMVLGLLKKTKDRDGMFDLMNNRITGGQRVYYILNAHFKDSAVFEGGYRWDRIEQNGSQDLTGSFDSLKNSIPDGIIKNIIAPKKAMVLKTGRIDSFAYAGMFIEMLKTGCVFDVHYATSFAFLPLALFLLGRNAEEYRDMVLGIYSREKLNGLLDITFPRESLFKSARLLKMANDISPNERAEFFQVQPILLAAKTDNSGRLFSTGRLADLITASLTTYPLFEPFTISGQEYISGYPAACCGVEELNRMDIDSVVQASIKPWQGFTPSLRIMPFYSKFLEYFDMVHGKDDSNITSSVSLEIEIPDNEDDPEKIIEIAGRTTNKFLKENHYI